MNSDIETDTLGALAGSIQIEGNVQLETQEGGYANDAIGVNGDFLDEIIREKLQLEKNYDDTIKLGRWRIKMTYLGRDNRPKPSPPSQQPAPSGFDWEPGKRVRFTRGPYRGREGTIKKTIGGELSTWGVPESILVDLGNGEHLWAPPSLLEPKPANRVKILCGIGDGRIGEVVEVDQSGESVRFKVRIDDRDFWKKIDEVKPYG